MKNGKVFSYNVDTTRTKVVLFQLVVPSEGNDMNERRKLLIVYEDCRNTGGSSKRKKKIRTGNQKKSLNEVTWEVLSILTAWSSGV